MADMRFVLPGSDTITLSGQTVDKLIRSCDGFAALLYLYIIRQGNSFSLKQAMITFGRDEKDISVSMELLKRLGLLQYDEAPPILQKEEMPEYTAEDIKHELEHGSAFKSLVQEVEKSFGKLLTSDDLTRLFGIYDFLRLPTDVIFQLVNYCISEHRRRYNDDKNGQRRMPTMRYIEKVAFTWEREGIVTLDMALKYIEELEVKRSQLSEIKKVLQIKDRELSQSERKYVDGWLAMGFSSEAIELAYDRTLLKTGRLAWSYMDSIISSWHQKGLRSVDDIQAKDGKNGKPVNKRPSAQPTRASAPSPSEVEHMKKFLEKLREE